MLEHYEKIPTHKIKKLQDLNKAILNIWINAKPDDVFSENFFSDQKFKDLILSEKSKPKKDSLYKPIADIFDIVKNDGNAQKELKRVFNINNKIELLCSNTGAHPISYNAFKPFKLDIKLKKFYEDFYNIVFGRPKIKDLFKTDLKEYYFDLKDKRELTVCPFCGLKPFKSRIEMKREAFDHYFAKAIYPFNSVNPENLVPMCSDCNSGYKSTKEVIYKATKKTDLNRIKAFYPFDSTIVFSGYTISMRLNKKSVNFRKLKEEDFDLIIEFSGKEVEVERWKSIYGIEKRYKGQIIDNSKIWFSILKEELKTDTIDKINRMRTIGPLSGMRFLQYMYLDCWNREGNLAKSLAE